MARRACARAPGRAIRSAERGTARAWWPSCSQHTLPRDELSIDGQLVVRARERQLGGLARAALDLEDDAAGPHDGDVALDAALAGAHACLGRLLRERVIREDSHVDLAALLHGAAVRDPLGFDPSRTDPARRQHLPSDIAVRLII